MLYKTAMPSVLIETGFLSNSNEERYLNNDDAAILYSIGDLQSV